ncbi:MAG: hypothetical protein KBG28_00145 [Kofleriaceae bacterium]|nr:hypothetical protein [Kofleriaceae bacterium]MBP9202357.1 hypothetical protein [Kofleriaceae bacterium]
MDASREGDAVTISARAAWTGVSSDVVVQVARDVEARQLRGARVLGAVGALFVGVALTAAVSVGATATFGPAVVAAACFIAGHDRRARAATARAMCLLAQADTEVSWLHAGGHLIARRGTTTLAVLESGRLRPAQLHAALPAARVVPPRR